MRIAATALGLLINLVSANAALATEWRGIVPLHSTQADVERLLGVPTTRSDEVFYYNNRNEIALIWFQSAACDVGPGRYGFGWNVPVGTVVSIGIIPKLTHKKPQSLSNDDFRVENENTGLEYFTNTNEGLMVELYHGAVTFLNYTPKESDNPLQCPRLEELGCVLPIKFDEYQSIPFQDEKARLDNWALAIDKLSRGVIVVLGETKSARNKLLKRAQRGKQFLVTKHGIEPNRILVLDGGHRDSFGTQLHIYPIGHELSRVLVFPQKDTLSTK